MAISIIKSIERLEKNPDSTVLKMVFSDPKYRDVLHVLSGEIREKAEESITLVLRKNDSIMLGSSTIYWWVHNKRRFEMQ